MSAPFAQKVVKSCCYAQDARIHGIVELRARRRTGPRTRYHAASLKAQQRQRISIHTLLLCPDSSANLSFSLMNSIYSASDFCTASTKVQTEYLFLLSRLHNCVNL